MSACALTPDAHTPAADLLAVAIVSYGSASLIPDCLRTLYATADREGLALDVVIADNDPRDPLAPLIAERFPRARVLPCENHGFGHGNNVAYRATSAPFVLFLNPDTEIREGSLRALLSRMAQDPGIGLLGCRQIDLDGALTPTIRRFPGVGRALADALGTERLVGSRSPGQRELRTGRYAEETHCDWTSGSFMLARRAALESLRDDPFDERFFLFCEEVDLCRRLADAGWSIRHSPELEILHHTNRAGVDSRLAAQEAFSRRLYADKHFSPARRATYLAATAAGYRLRGALARIRVRPGAGRADAADRARRTLSGVEPPPFVEESR